MGRGRFSLTGELWQAELGPMGGDEINILEADHKTSASEIRSRTCPFRRPRQAFTTWRLQLNAVRPVARPLLTQNTAHAGHPPARIRGLACRHHTPG